MEDGYTKEEWKMVVETKKILDPKIKLTATCVRVPVFISHSEAVNIEFENPITADEARDILRERARLPRHRQARGRRLRHAARGGGRGRHLHLAHPRGRDRRERPRLWCVSDNLRKGAALNAVQIAEARGGVTAAARCRR
jgi:aspartate-semialdehyde dehydrogenase